MRSALLPLLAAAVPSALFSEIILRENGTIIDSSLEKQAGGKVIKSDPAGDDILLLNNGDLMHGTFGGINDGLLWERSDIERPIRFNLPGIRQVVRKGGKAIKLHNNSSFFTLVSGDRIPGEIVSMDDKSLVIKSNVAGNLTIPRAHLKSISPNPYDGNLFYSGPYTSDSWAILENSLTEVEMKEEKAQKEDNKKEEESKTPDQSSPWIHSGASFYNLGAKPLVFPDAKMPEVGRLSFKVEWKGRFNLTLALLSDFTRVFPVEKEEEKEGKEEEAQDKEVFPPAEGSGAGKAEKKAEKEKEEEEENEAPPETRSERLVDLRDGNGFQSIPWININERNNALIYGSGYTLNLYSTYPYLYRNSFSESGEPISRRMDAGGNRVNLTGQSEADIEFRYDRKKGLLLLYINGNYSSQWTDLTGMPGQGTGFGIINTAVSARTRISDVRISTWNGMKDNARSMAHPERDVILLVNGTDRFSGELLKIEDGIAHVKSQYVTARIPATEIAHIVLKKSGTTDLESEELPDDLSWEGEPLAILYEPFGLIQLNPVSATRDRIKGTSPFLGDLDIDLSSSSILRFSDGSPDLADWFEGL
jgi:hypothetical protein